ncbi:hypothetical protein M2140_000141 [Clostridiales Family XIII bacterium PM5-7]
MKQKYGYVETSALAATYGGGHIYSVVADEVLENGMLVTLGAVIDAENYKVETPDADSKVVLVANPALIYDQSTKAAQEEIYYFIEGGTPARAYDLMENDRFAIVDYLVTEPLAGADQPVEKGNFLVCGTDRKYKEVAAAGFDKTAVGFAAEIVEIVYKSNMTIYRLRVVKNA